MKYVLLLAITLLAFTITTPLVVHAEPAPELIAEKMAVKFVRGATNFFTCIVEVPKQTVITGREMGPVGYVVGPVKGFGLGLYRGLVGMTEAIFFMVPQPGYYDPTMEPAYVWQGWESKRETTQALPEEAK